MQNNRSEDNSSFFVEDEISINNEFQSASQSSSFEGDIEGFDPEEFKRELGMSNTDDILERQLRSEFGRSFDREGQFEAPSVDHFDDDDEQDVQPTEETKKDDGIGGIFQNLFGKKNEVEKDVDMGQDTSIKDEDQMRNQDQEIYVSEDVFASSDDNDQEFDSSSSDGENLTSSAENESYQYDDTSGYPSFENQEEKIVSSMSTTEQSVADVELQTVTPSVNIQPEYVPYRDPNEDLVVQTAFEAQREHDDQIEDEHHIQETETPQQSQESTPDAAAASVPDPVAADPVVPVSGAAVRGDHEVIHEHGDSQDSTISIDDVRRIIEITDEIRSMSDEDYNKLLASVEDVEDEASLVLTVFYNKNFTMDEGTTLLMQVLDYESQLDRVFAVVEMNETDLAHLGETVSNITGQDLGDPFDKMKYARRVVSVIEDMGDSILDKARELGLIR